MSMFTYIGAYLELTDIHHTVIEKHLVCPTHPKHTYDKTTKFCPTCGTKLESLTRKVSAIKSLLDDDLKYENEMVDVTYHIDHTFNNTLILIPNKKNAGDIYSFERTGIYQLNNIQPAEYIQQLHTTYHDYITFLLDVKQFRVHYKFGVITYHI